MITRIPRMELMPTAFKRERDIYIYKENFQRWWIWVLWSILSYQFETYALGSMDLSSILAVGCSKKLSDIAVEAVDWKKKSNWICEFHWSI